ncbi:MAG: hypothetical protein AAFQ32_04690 [Pseudomonadota bacterium]
MTQTYLGKTHDELVEIISVYETIAPYLNTGTFELFLAKAELGVKQAMADELDDRIKKLTKKISQLEDGEENLW